MNLNVEISIEEEVNTGLDVLRAARGMTKKAIIAEALTHYVRCVGGEETTNVIRRQQAAQRSSP